MNTPPVAPPQTLKEAIKRGEECLRQARQANERQRRWKELVAKVTADAIAAGAIDGTAIPNP